MAVSWESNIREASTSLPFAGEERREEEARVEHEAAEQDSCDVAREVDEQGLFPSPEMRTGRSSSATAAREEDASCVGGIIFWVAPSSEDTGSDTIGVSPVAIRVECAVCIARCVWVVAAAAAPPLEVGAAIEEEEEERGGVEDNDADAEESGPLDVVLLRVAGALPFFLVAIDCSYRILTSFFFFFSFFFSQKSKEREGER